MPGIASWVCWNRSSNASLEGEISDEGQSNWNWSEHINRKLLSSTMNMKYLQTFRPTNPTNENWLMEKFAAVFSIRFGWNSSFLPAYSVADHLSFPTVKLRSKGFQGTGLIFPIDWNSLIANIEINRKMLCGTWNIFPYRRISFPAGSLGAKFHCMPDIENFMYRNDQEGLKSHE